jgi:hypothetical protein
VAVGGLALYRVEVVPPGLIPDEDIHWSCNSGSVTFYAGHNTGGEAIVRGVSPGAFTLEVSVGDLPATYHPYIHGQVLPPAVTPIHVYIICDANGTPAVSTATVDAWVAEANRIYQQAAMTFTRASVTTVTGHNDWFEIDDSTEFYQMTSYASNTGGLELYCVTFIEKSTTNGRHSSPQIGGAARGMAVRAGAHLATLAHEIGHACGLKDLYKEYYPCSGLVSEDKVTPPNWSGGEGTGYYSPTLSYCDLTYRCLMDTVRPSTTRADIPLDGIMMMQNSGGGPYPISVGLGQMGNRQPEH